MTDTQPKAEPDSQPIEVDSGEHRYIAPIKGHDDERIFTDSGIEIDKLYDPSDVAEGLEERLGEPGEYPFTRGIHDGMYRDRLWTMRQYAGFSSPEDTNGRYRYLLEHGSTGLSMAFDLPTQLGRDSDDPLCEGEVGRTGVPIDTIEDMRICFDQIPLDQVSTSMTINAPAVGSAAPLRTRRRGAGRRARRSSAAPSRTTSSRSTSPAATSSTRPRRPCA